MRTGRRSERRARRIRIVGPTANAGWSRPARRHRIAALPLYVPVGLLQPRSAAVVYLCVFTAQDRRGLRDLVADTMVVTELP